MNLCKCKELVMVQNKLFNVINEQKQIEHDAQHTDHSAAFIAIKAECDCGSHIVWKIFHWLNKDEILMFKLFGIRRLSNAY